MTDDFVRMLIEDHDLLGPAAFPDEAARSGQYMPPACRADVPRAQAERWAQAQEAWEAAQAEMRAILLKALRQQRELLRGTGRRR